MSDKTATEVAREKIENIILFKRKGSEPKLILNLSFIHNGRKCRVGVYYEDGGLPDKKTCSKPTSSKF